MAGAMPEGDATEEHLLTEAMDHDNLGDMTEPGTETPWQDDEARLALVDGIDAPGSYGRLIPVVATLLAVGWIATMLVLSAPTLDPLGAPVAFVGFVGALLVPPALIGILYLLGLRTSRAEAGRWGATARAMRHEAATLEQFVGSLSHAIEDNRVKLAEQTALLMSLGDSAAERLQSIANGMGEQARSIDRSAHQLVDAAAGAEKSTSVVLASLPKAHAELTEMARTLDAAGLNAGEHTAALDARLAALAERGREAESIATGAAQKLAANIARMEATSESAGARLEVVTGEMSTAVDQVLDRAAQAVDEARKGIAAQGDAMLAMLSTNQAALDRAGRDSVEALAERIAAVEAAIGRVGNRLNEEQAHSDALFDAVAAAIERADHGFETFHRSGTTRAQELAASISALTVSAEAMNAAIDTGDRMARTVIKTAEDLLIALDASAREIDETLPDALARLDNRIGSSRQVVASAKPELLALVTAAESTHEAIEAIANVVQQQRDTLSKTQESLLATLDTGHDKAGELGGIVDTTIASATRFAEDAAPQLIDSLQRIRQTASQAADHARSALAEIVPDAARAIEQASGEAIARAIDSSARRPIEALASQSEAAMAAARTATAALDDQIAKLGDSMAMVQQRLDTARAEIEEAERTHFAGQVSTLVEALNSASIDIVQCFSSEVTDTAWAAYLKGDRGVFTRRAVRLLEGNEARQIADLYHADENFRSQVNRYIHDFEAMLRQILAMREGSQLGITLLSSDMGKLYVALAQAIERLRN